jgi:tetratricopeptide (TPR) repeat protein
MPSAQRAAGRAVEQDPQLAEAHRVLGVVLHYSYDPWGAERELRRALRLRPDLAEARAWFAYNVLAIAFGRFDEAIEEVSKARRADPLSGSAASYQGFVLSTAGRHAAAVEAALEGAELDPDSTLAHLALMNTYLGAGRVAEAVVIGLGALRTVGRPPFLSAMAASCHVARGRMEDARTLHEELVARAAESYVQESVLAWTAAAIGRGAEAIEHADRAWQARDPVLPLILQRFGPTEPVRQVLRDAGRYDEFLSRLGLA